MVITKRIVILPKSVQEERIIENIDLFDFALIKRALLGISEPSGIYWRAADCNKDGELDLFDFAVVKRYILGIGNISQ